MRMDAKSVRNMYSIIAVTNKHTAKLHHVGSLYISEWVSWIFSSHLTNSLRSSPPDVKAISDLRCHRNFIFRFLREREIHRKWEARGQALAFRHDMNSVADTIWSPIFSFTLFINIIPLLKSDLSHKCQVDSFIHFQNEESQFTAPISWIFSGLPLLSQNNKILIKLAMLSS